VNIDRVQIERGVDARCYEISVLLSTDTEEGSYTFEISDVEWAKAIDRGDGRTGATILSEPLPWLLVAKKKENADASHSTR